VIIDEGRYSERALSLSLSLSLSRARARASRSAQHSMFTIALASSWKQLCEHRSLLPPETAKRVRGQKAQDRQTDRQNSGFVYYTARILRNTAMPGPLTPSQ
jgi:hypothetical protein